MRHAMPLLALALVIAGCTTTAPARFNGADVQTVQGTDGRARDYKILKVGENDYDLYVLAPEFFHIPDRPLERRERLRAMATIMQARCPAGKTAQVFDPQDDTHGREMYARGRCV